MPGMNGRQLYEELATSLAGLKVIFLSGYTYDVIAEHGVLMQGVNLIPKP
jgi:YesN/AraC family two-component response regulator